MYPTGSKAGLTPIRYNKVSPSSNRPATSDLQRRIPGKHKTYILHSEKRDKVTRSRPGIPLPSSVSRPATSSQQSGRPRTTGQAYIFHPKRRYKDPRSRPGIPLPSTFKVFQQKIRVTIGISKEESSKRTIFPMFQSHMFDSSKPQAVRDYLFAKKNESPGLLLVIIEGWDTWIGAQLETVLPEFPASVFAQWNSETAILPSFETTNMDHVETWPVEQVETPDRYSLGSYEARRLPIALWCNLESAFKTDPGTEPTGFPIVVLVYEDGRRWKRLETYAFWIYNDLVSIFTDWDGTWDAARRNLNDYSEQLYENHHSSLVLLQTQKLHRDTAATIDLRESMRLHAFSVKHFLDCLKENKSSISSDSTLVGRLQTILLKLEYYDLASHTLLEQQHNLLNLIFNTEAVIQTQAVNRIAVLGFVFLPLSFVATIFGITTFTASPRWYPVAAVPVMILTVFVAWSMSWAIPLWQKRKLWTIGIRNGATLESP